MELRKKSNTNENVSIFSTQKERVEMAVDVRNMSHITSLLTDLYKNPIEATVRETVSNAIDTTKRLPEDERKPINIKLPTEMSPDFVVQDFGEGMDRDTLSKVFSQYGNSTKGTDLSQIGAFGLGAKAPLSYASKFTVESTKDGITTEVFLSSTSEGNFCELLESKNTGKPNGTTVTIPVRDNEEDVWDFNKAVMLNYGTYSFDVDIEVNGKPQKNKYQEEIGNIKVGEVDGKPVYSKLYIVMDSKEKAIDRILTSVVSGDSLAKSYSRCVGYTYCGWNYSSMGECFFVEIVPGMFDFSSSRDEITKNDRFKEVHNLIMNQIADLISKKQEDILHNNSWSLWESVNAFSSCDLGMLKSRGAKVSNEDFVELIENPENSIIPLEFAFGFPYYYSSYYRVYSSELNGEFHESRLSDAKNRVLNNREESRKSLESLLFSAHNIVFVTDIPKGENDRENKKNIKTLLDDLRRYNKEKFSKHESSMTFVGTYMTEEEVENIITNLEVDKFLKKKAVVPYYSIVGNKEKVKTTKKVDNELKGLEVILTKEKNISISPTVTFSKDCQSIIDLEKIKKDKTPTLVIFNKVNNSTNTEKLEKQLFSYLHTNQQLRILFVRMSYLKTDYAKELISLADYIHSFVQEDNLLLEYEKDVKEKNFLEQGFNNKIPIPEELDLKARILGDEKYKDILRYKNRLDLDLSGLVPREVLNLDVDDFNSMTLYEKNLIRFGVSSSEFNEVEYILTDIEECLNDLKLLFPFVSVCWAMNQKNDDSIIRETVQFFVDKKTEELKNK